MVRRAVIIGSNGPEDAGKLKYAEEDAERVAVVLAHPRCGFVVARIRDVTDPYEVRRGIADVVDQCEPDDTLFVYFSGHGFIEGGSLWLMLDRTEVKKKLKTALQADGILSDMKHCSARHKVLMLDCCHAGMVFSGSQMKDAGTKLETTVVPQIDQESESFITVVASDRLERTREFDELQGSFLTSAFCRALTDSFTDADKDKDGAIDLADLRSWISREANSHNRKKSAHQVPIPFIFGRERGRLFFTREPGEWASYEFQAVPGFDFVLLPYIEMSRAWAIGKIPVTNSQYREFTRAIGIPDPTGKYLFRDGGSVEWREPFQPWDDAKFNDPKQPVVCVSLHDAVNFVDWLNSGISLSKGVSIYVVPPDVWDMAAFGSPYYSNDPRDWAGENIHHKMDRPAVLAGEDLRKNRLGIVDLFGNVWEWTYLDLVEQDFHVRLIAAPYWQERVQELRGGSFLDDLSRGVIALKAGELDEGISTKHFDLGFRLACSIEMQKLPSEVQTSLASTALERQSLGLSRTPITA